jgi:hypothetical protein
MKRQKWSTFTPPATAQRRHYHGRVLLRRSHLPDWQVLPGTMLVSSLMETNMLNLIDLERHRLELFRQQTNTLDGLMTMFRVATNLILEEMEPFRKYGREPHLDLSTCSQYIRLRLTVQKKGHQGDFIQLDQRTL